MTQKNNFYKKVNINDYAEAFLFYKKGKYPPHIFSMISLTVLAFILEEEKNIYNQDMEKDFLINKINEDFLDFELIKSFILSSEDFLFPLNIKEILLEAEEVLLRNEKQLSSF